MRPRAYLDWNATAPLLPEARSAALAAMDAGNPSSVHAEGRQARGVVERARAQVAALAGVEPDRVVFTAGATEAAALAAANLGQLICAPVEHDCVLAHAEAALPVDVHGRVSVAAESAVALQCANSETGVLQPAPDVPVALEDAAQAAGRIGWRFDPARAAFAILSAHKLGGPKGIGALIAAPGRDVTALLPGGGQEQGRRAGTEAVALIAGFGAAAEAARMRLDDWAATASLRDRLEARLAEAAPDAIFVGKGSDRLPNTSCIALPGWSGEMQVMQLDLAGFAVSAGSACSSGKVRESRVLRAMGLDAETARSAIRVSIGPETTRDEIDRFCEAWTGLYAKRRAKAA